MNDKDFEKMELIIKRVFSVEYKNQKELKKYLLLNLKEYLRQK